MSEEAPRRPEREQPRERRVHVNGVELALFEWAGEGPPFLFVHATGFHARCWDEVVRRMPGRLAYAVDMRGHGRSEKPGEPYEWSRFGKDVRELVRALDLEQVIGVGHSMGGHSVTYAAGYEPGVRFAALLLVDPVIGAPEAYRGRPGGEPRPDSAAVAQRRNRWGSPEEMYQRFVSGGPFVGWERGVLRDYCEHGLLPEGDGYVLACPPAVEAEIYRHAMGTDIHELLGSIDVPVRVLRAPRTPGAAPFASSPTWPPLASRFPRGEDVALERGTHFIPMESPGLVAAHALELAAAVARA